MLPSTQKQENPLETATQMLASANEAAGVVRGLYSSFLFLIVYIALILAGTTHEMLLRISPVGLPLLNVDIPILGFYSLVPYIFLIVHFNLLIQFYLLARKLRLFDSAVQQLSETDAHQAELLRERLANTTFSHLLAGHQHDTFMRFLLTVIVWITVVIAPLFLLLWTQAGFLPFHSEPITWAHRIAIVIDSLILQVFWVRIRNPHSYWDYVKEQGFHLFYFVAYALNKIATKFNYNLPKSMVNVLNRERYIFRGMMVFSFFNIAVLCTAFFVVTIPDRTMERVVLKHAPAAWIDESIRPMLSLTKILFETRYYETEGGEESLFKRNLILREKVLTANELPVEIINALKNDNKNISTQIIGINLQGRDLAYADLIKAKLPKADLRDANLNGANLLMANLHDANLEKASLNAVTLMSTKLNGANLSWAEMNAVDLGSAILTGANLSSAKLNGADMLGAIFQAANLRDTELNGANLSLADFVGANLRGATLNGADLNMTNFRAADLTGANLNAVKLLEDGYITADFNIANLAEIKTIALTQKEYQVLEKTFKKYINYKERYQQIMGNLEKAMQKQPINLAQTKYNNCFNKEYKLCINNKKEYEKIRDADLIKLACNHVELATGVYEYHLAMPYASAGSKLALNFLNFDCLGINRLKKYWGKRNMLMKIKKHQESLDFYQPLIKYKQPENENEN